MTEYNPTEDEFGACCDPSDGGVCYDDVAEIECLYEYYPGQTCIELFDCTGEGCCGGNLGACCYYSDPPTLGECVDDVAEMDCGAYYWYRGRTCVNVFGCVGSGCCNPE